jgi:hypothetical protein
VCNQYSFLWQPFTLPLYWFRGKKGMFSKNSQTTWKKRSDINLDVVYFNYQPKLALDAFSEIYIWDLDKTYLDTTIDSLKGLFATVFEKSFSKKNVPGANELIKSLARFRAKNFSEEQFPLFFVSASPPQMERKIFEKFELDQIHPLGMFYKDNLKNLVPSKFTFLKRQVGYKLQALMQLRTQLREDVRIMCFGDDSESDVIVYNLFSDVCARRHTKNQLERLLDKLGVPPVQVEEILRLQSLVDIQDPVEKIYINLATDTDADYYTKFGRRTLATYDSFQIALDLVQDQRLSLEELGSVMDELRTKYGFGPAQITKSFQDLIRRRVMGLSSFEMIKNYLIERKVISHSWVSPTVPLREKIVENGHVYELEGLFEPWVRPEINYLHEY